jgi:hypothetical protein
VGAAVLRLSMLSLIILTSLAVPAYWLVELWPFLMRQGPAPGVGGMWVFAMIPTVALSTIGLLVASPLELREVRRGAVRPAWPFVLLAIVGMAGAIVLVGYWIWILRQVLGELAT